METFTHGGDPFPGPSIFFTFDDQQEKTTDDPKYMGINTFTLGPQDVYGGLLGMYVNIHLRKSRL